MELRNENLTLSLSHETASENFAYLKDKLRQISFTSEQRCFVLPSRGVCSNSCKVLQEFFLSFEITHNGKKMTRFLRQF